MMHILIKEYTMQWWKHSLEKITEIVKNAASNNSNIQENFIILIIQIAEKISLH